MDQQCSVDKFAIEHEGTVQYDHSLPKLDQFTICNWMRFTNHSGDHVMFTYAGNFDKQKKKIKTKNSFQSTSHSFLK